MNGLAWRASVPFMGTVGSNPTPSGDGLLRNVFVGVQKFEKAETAVRI